ncbi:unnamed protein product [Danaus chrysippus]|uniref:(African queen) hypothetical protein n=1 Tax=Danaus chrysippus TaxID=151541 RepID=A0A8J2QUN2_9NEOP|nr:unnamed protein product [Danaus chrysippus]
MGCNTSSEAKVEEKNSEENKTNTDTEEKQKETAQESKSEEEAATKIQAAFRGHKTRKSISMKAANKNDPEPEPTKAELEAEFRADDKDDEMYYDTQACIMQGLSSSNLVLIRSRHLLIPICPVTS